MRGGDVFWRSTDGQGRLTYLWAWFVSQPPGGEARKTRVNEEGVGVLLFQGTSQPDEPSSDKQPGAGQAEIGEDVAVSLWAPSSLGTISSL